MVAVAPVLDSPERLKALRQTGLLDSPPEDLFDRFARMAAKLLSSPMSIITVVTEERQFFKSAVGLPEPWATARQTPLSHSLCKYVASSGQPFVVGDALRDDRVCTNLAVQDLHVAAYLGVPLTTRSGYTIGSFAVMDSNPREWSERETSLMKDLAVFVMAQIELPAESAARHMAEKELERMRDDLQVAVEAAGVGIWNWDLTGDDFGCSERCRELLGLMPGETLTYARFLAALHPDDRQITDEKIRHTLATKKEFALEYRTIWPDQSVHWIFAKGRGIYHSRTDEPERFTGALIDITERKISEQQLRESKEAAEAANHTKDDFLAALSHELRTPLNPVLMIASELEHSPEIPERVREDFSVIRKNVELEARLIDDLLDLTRVLRGKLQLNIQETDVHVPMRQAIGILQADLENKQLDLSLDLAATDTILSADPVRLQQVFWNVLKNAIKFTPARGKIWISSRNLANGTVRIEIMDSGIGILPGEEERIFLAFGQSSNGHGHRFGGLGLGLSISKLLVEMHHGRIWARSAGRNTGATFFIELPVGPTSLREATPAPPRSAQAPVKGLRILLVEDHEQTRRTLARLLTRRGHEVTSAETLMEGRMQAAANGFDLLVSDIGLPDGSGEDLMREVSRTHHLKGIALSGYGMEDDVQRSLEAGFAAHLTKPINIEVLERTIREVWGAVEG